MRIRIYVLKIADFPSIKHLYLPMRFSGVNFYSNFITGQMASAHQGVLLMFFCVKPPQFEILDKDKRIATPIST